MNWFEIALIAIIGIIIFYDHVERSAMRSEIKHLANSFDGLERKLR